MMFTSKRITFTSDTLTLVGYIYTPADVSSPPGILFLHGAGKSTSQRFKLWQPYLAERGISSFAFDYRGCGESEGKFEDSSLNNRLIDAEHGLKTFLDTGIDRNNLTVSGASMSGHVAVKLIEKNPWVRSIILQCAAAYGSEAENKPLNESFTTIITQTNSWIDSPVFPILENYPGKVYSFYGDHDEVIPMDIQHHYNNIAKQKGESFILHHATHTLLQPQNKLQEEAMYRMFDVSSSIITEEILHPTGG